MKIMGYYSIDVPAMTLHVRARGDLAALARAERIARLIHRVLCKDRAPDLRVQQCGRILGHVNRNGDVRATLTMPETYRP